MKVTRAVAQIYAVAVSKAEPGWVAQRWERDNNLAVVTGRCADGTTMAVTVSPREWLAYWHPKLIQAPQE